MTLEKRIHYTQWPDVLALGQTHIFVVGDLILDCYVEGMVRRISPEAPVPILNEESRRFVPGGAGNVAANLTAMGAQAWLCGRVGSDDSAKNMKDSLAALGVNEQNFIETSHLPTTTKWRLISKNTLTSGFQQMMRVDRESTAPLSEADEQFVKTRYQEFLATFPKNRALVLSDYGKGVLTKTLIQDLIEISQKAGVPIVSDPKSEDVARYAGSTVVKPNRSEARAAYRTAFPGASEQVFTDVWDEAKTLAQYYLEKSQVKNVVMSLSEYGLCALGENVSGLARLKTRALQVADVSGAGDTLVAFLAMGLAAGLTLEKSTELANLAAGVVCQKMGTATVGPGEVIEALQNSETISEKRVPVPLLRIFVEDLQKQKRKVVFTNGCFDILHAGHVDYLQQAKALGDILVVGLNSDASVRRLKGPTRPVQTWENRAFILAGLGCVDFVVSFDEDTPLELILQLKPDILVKGADYTVENTVGAKEVMGWGGEVAHIPLVEGQSTTKILRHVQDLSLKEK